jgi:quercetin dioxygenase-like cupin family protein
MAFAGLTVRNPLSGERYTFLKTGADTGGELLLVDIALPPDAKVSDHVHRLQEERFEVLSGSGYCRVADTTRPLRRGVVVVVPPDTAHSLWSGEEQLLMRAEFRPALDLAEQFEAACVPD